MRGRIFAVASSCSGRPCFSIAIVTTVLSVPSWASTDLTLPTSTPAIRTGESGCRPFEDWNTALTSYGRVNGMSFVKPRNVEDQDHDERDQPDGERAAALAAAAAAGHQGFPSVAACCVPGTFDVTVWPWM